MRAVIQYDPETNDRVAFYPSIKDAALSIGVSSAAISRALSGLLTNVKGWGWRDATPDEKETMVLKCIREYNERRDLISYYVIEGESDETR